MLYAYLIEYHSGDPAETCEIVNASGLWIHLAALTLWLKGMEIPGEPRPAVYRELLEENYRHALAEARTR